MRVWSNIVNQWVELPDAAAQRLLDTGFASTEEPGGDTSAPASSPNVAAPNITAPNMGSGTTDTDLSSGFTSGEWDWMDSDDDAPLTDEDREAAAQQVIQDQIAGPGGIPASDGWELTPTDDATDTSAPDGWWSNLPEDASVQEVADAIIASDEVDADKTLNEVFEESVEAAMENAGYVDPGYVPPWTSGEGGGPGNPGIDVGTTGMNTSSGRVDDQIYTDAQDVTDTLNDITGAIEPGTAGTNVAPGTMTLDPVMVAGIPLSVLENRQGLSDLDLDKEALLESGLSEDQVAWLEGTQDTPGPDETIEDILSDIEIPDSDMSDIDDVIDDAIDIGDDLSTDGDGNPVVDPPTDVVDDPDTPTTPPIYDPDTGEVVDQIGDLDDIIIGGEDGLIVDVPPVPGTDNGSGENPEAPEVPGTQPDPDPDPGPKPPLIDDNGDWSWDETMQDWRWIVDTQGDDTEPTTETEVDPVEPIEPETPLPPATNTTDDPQLPGPVIPDIDFIPGNGNSNDGGDPVTGVGDWFTEIFNDFDFDMGGILEGGINMYGSDKMGEAYEKSAEEALAWQKELQEWQRPFWETGKSNLSGLEAATGASLDADPRETLRNLDATSDVTSTLGDRPEAFGGFEDLREFEGKTGDWDYGQITEGSDAWNQLTDDAIRMAENAKKARGRLGTQEAKDSALKSMIRAMGDIENVNLQRLDQETTRRGYDRDTAASQRAQEAGEQLSSSQLSFQQLADRRNQAFREKFADEQATFERSMAANDQQLAERQQYWNELVGSDMQEWQKLFEQARLGQSGASGAATAATNASNILSGQALAGAAGAQSKYSNIADIFRSQFPAGGTA